MVKRLLAFVVWLFVLWISLADEQFIELFFLGYRFWVVLAENLASKDLLPTDWLLSDHLENGRLVLKLYRLCHVAAAPRVFNHAFLEASEVVWLWWIAPIVNKLFEWEQPRTALHCLFLIEWVTWGVIWRGCILFAFTLTLILASVELVPQLEPFLGHFAEDQVFYLQHLLANLVGQTLIEGVELDGPLADQKTVKQELLLERHRDELDMELRLVDGIQFLVSWRCWQTRLHHDVGVGA